VRLLSHNPRYMLAFVFVFLTILANAVLKMAIEIFTSDPNMKKVADRI